MSEVLGSLLSAVKPRPQLAKREVESASRFVLDEAKFFADIGARANGSFDERDEYTSFLGVDTSVVQRVLAAPSA